MRVVYEIYHFRGESEISPSGYVINDESERFNHEEYTTEAEAMEVLREHFRETDNEDEQFIVVKVFKK